MRIKILQEIDTDGKILLPETYVDETEYDPDVLEEWALEGLAEIEDDSSEPRSASRDKTKYDPQDFIEYLEGTLDPQWGYVWGGKGLPYTAAERDRLYSIFKSSKYDYEYFYVTQWKRWKDRNVADCSGLIESYTGLNVTANSYYKRCVDTGRYDSFPKIPGYLLFRYSSSSDTMVHVGIYVGDGYTIESKDSATGVVKRTLAQGKWTHWGQPDFLVFSTAEPEEPHLFNLCRLLRKKSPLMKGDDVEIVQSILIKAGYSVGSSGADGIFGSGTQSAVRAFQKAHGLGVDGIVGKKTAEALGGKWTGA